MWVTGDRDGSEVVAIRVEKEAEVRSGWRWKGYMVVEDRGGRRQRWYLAGGWAGRGGQPRWWWRRVGCWWAERVVDILRFQG